MDLPGSMMNAGRIFAASLGRSWARQRSQAGFLSCAWDWYKICILGVFPALAFVADFLPAAPEFHQRTHRVRLRNLGTADKKSSHKIKHKKIPGVHPNPVPCCLLLPAIEAGNLSDSVQIVSIVHICFGQIQFLYDDNSR